MALRYSTYEAKAKFGEVIRRVRQGQRVIIAYRGKDVAEIQPINEPVNEALEERIRRLQAEGIIGPDPDPRVLFRVGKRKRGALKRFLESRD
jgi:prevent-host-death family protein